MTTDPSKISNDEHRSRLAEVLPHITARNMNNDHEAFIKQDCETLERVLKFLDGKPSPVLFEGTFRISVRIELKRRKYTVTPNPNAGISEVECGCTTSHGSFCRGCSQWTEIGWVTEIKKNMLPDTDKGSGYPWVPVHQPGCYPK